MLPAVAAVIVRRVMPLAPVAVSVRRSGAVSLRIRPTDMASTLSAITMPSAAALVTARVRRRGVGTKLVAVASDGARAAGCEWLHVDFEDHLRSFYFDSCGFSPAKAGLIALKG